MSRISAYLKRLVKKRAAYYCEYCQSQEKYSPQPFSIEHIIPIAKNGTDTDDNLALACMGCNGYKYIYTFGFDVITQKEVPLFNPRKYKWTDHFAWNDSATQIIALTAIGRVTVEILKLNREGLVNLRQIMVNSGKHPPKTFNR